MKEQDIGKMNKSMTVKLKYKHSRGTTHINIGDLADINFRRVLPHAHPEKAVLITDGKVNDRWGGRIREWLRIKNVLTVIIPCGEAAKDWKQLEKVFRKLHLFDTDRTVPLISLGGGTVSDVAGFAASIYLRGLPHIIIPTTLLAQVDAALGGKTAINFFGAKNIIGSFYQPRNIFIDPEFLSTLPRRELASGLAEIIKCCFMEGEDALNEFRKALGEYKTKSVSAYRNSIVRSIKYKIRLVRADEFDVLDKRVFLNFGHTIGHAIEAAESLRGLTHGESVGLGMIAACYIASKMNKYPESKLAEFVNIIKSAGLPTSFAGLDKEKILKYIKNDKKISGGELAMLLPDVRGKVRKIDNISLQLVRDSLNELCVMEGL